MKITVNRSVTRALLALLVCGGPWVAALAADAPTYTLENRRWEMISPPGDVGGATLAQIFGDELPTAPGAYGRDWLVYATTPPASAGVGPGYALVGLNETLKAGEGYWMIQATGRDVTVALPATATVPAGVPRRGCPSIAGCTDSPLKMTSDGREFLWNLTGLPIVEPVPLSRTAVVTDTGACASGCDFPAARAANVMNLEMWRYVDAGGVGYERIRQDATLEPWQAVWVAVLKEAAGKKPRWTLGAKVPDQRPNLAADYTMAFEENFDGPALSRDKWNTGLLWGPYVTINDEEQMYVDTLAAHPDSDYDPFVFTGKGTMKIVASKVGTNGVELPVRPEPDDPVWKKLDYNRNDKPKTKPTDREPWDASRVNYLSGILTSYDAFRFAHGYAEIRAKVSTGPGLWPAFWLLPSQYVDIVPEIDVMEHLGQNANEVYHTYHFFERNPPPNDWQARRTPTYETVGPDFSKAFHTYGVAWEPGQLIYYVDGKEVRRVRDGDASASGQPIRLPRQAMYLIANLAVGGTWPGAPTARTPFPAEYEIDYIRAYKKRNKVPVDLAQYKLAFGDEFDGSSLDASKWNTSFLWGAFLPINCEEQYYVDTTGIDAGGYSPFEVSGGQLKITAAKAGTLPEGNVPSILPDPLPASLATSYPQALQRCRDLPVWKNRDPTFQPRAYTSGMITSYDSFQFLGGYAEIRAKVPAGDGLWPAFWLLNGYYVRRNPEIDVMEIVGERPERLHTSYHRIGASGNMESQASQVDRGQPGVGLSDAFHTYGVQWNRNQIVWYLDGREVWRVEEDRVSDQLMYVIANLAVGGNFNTKRVDETKLPAELLIDHIRVYQEKPTP